jgi:hypothetical protein
VLIDNPPRELSPELPGVRWDPRTQTYRAPAYCYHELRCALQRQGRRFQDDVLRPAGECGAWRPIELRSYQHAALCAWQSGMCSHDFLLRHRTTGEQYWLDYLSKKLTQLRAAGLSRLILCVDDNRSCSAAELESLGSVVRFRRRIDPLAVIALIE